MLCPHPNENLSDQSKSTALPCFFIRKVLKNDEFCFYVIYTNETLVLLDFFEKIFIFLKKVFLLLTIPFIIPLVSSRFAQNYRWIYLNTNTPPRFTFM